MSALAHGWFPSGYANETEWLRAQLAEAKACIKAHQAVLDERAAPAISSLPPSPPGQPSASAGPDFGDRPHDRLIASLPIPLFDMTKPANVTYANSTAGVHIPLPPAQPEGCELPLPWKERIALRPGGYLDTTDAMTAMGSEIAELRAALAARQAKDLGQDVDDVIAELGVADEVAAIRAARQAPAPKDHNVRQLVNDLRDIALTFHATQQLRARISDAVGQFLSAQEKAK